MTVAVWIVSGLAALLFVAAGAAKILRPKSAIQEQMAWAADFSGGQIKAIGALEILGAVGLIVPVATGILPILTPIAALGLIAIRQRATQLALDIEGGVAGGAAEKALANLVRCHRIAVARQHLGMHAARDDLAVDEHAVAVKNDKIVTLSRTQASSSSGTQ